MYIIIIVILHMATMLIYVLQKYYPIIGCILDFPLPYIKRMLLAVIVLEFKAHGVGMASKWRSIHTDLYENR